MKKVYRILVFSIIGFFIVWFFILKDFRYNKLIKKGNIYIDKIEKFRVENNRLPYTLLEIGILEKEGDDEIWYEIVDSTNCKYFIAFGETMDYANIYCSDTKKWGKSNREMNNCLE